MSYWVASDKIPIQQKSVRIPAENGTDYIAGQEIRIRVDPSLKFFNPEQTYLECDVLIKTPTFSASGSSADNLPCPTLLNLDAETGFQSCCRSVRIHDSNGVLLEELENYNTMVSVKYDYQSNESLRNKRALTEGSQAPLVANRGTVGSGVSQSNAVYNNAFFSRDKDATEYSASFTSADMTTAKICMPIHSGILSNNKIFPNMLLGGITITILLEDNNRVFRQVDGAMRFRRLTLNPQFFQAKQYQSATYGPVADNGSFHQFTLRQRNSVGEKPVQCPFVVGEKLGFQRWITGNASVVAFDTNPAHSPHTKLPVIKKINLSGKYINIELNASVKINGKGMNGGTEEIFIFSNSVADATAYEPTYTVSNVNLIVGQVDPGAAYESSMMKRMKEGGVINYDFNSVTTYKYSQLASDRVANIRLPINNSRCKSIICVPTDATVYSTKNTLNASLTYPILTSETDNREVPDFYLRSNRPGLEGVIDEVSSYQWLYDGRLQPNRLISLTKMATTKSIDAQWTIETDKALSQAGITGHSFAKLYSNFVIGRALALGDAVYDARNKDFSLQVNYEGTIAPSKNKLWLSYVFHIRRIQISNNNVSVIV